MSQRSRDAGSGEPLHAETGYFRLHGWSVPEGRTAGESAAAAGEDSALQPDPAGTTAARARDGRACRVELVLAQPSGVVEIDTGRAAVTAGGRSGRDPEIEILVASQHVACAPSAKEVTSVRRRIKVTGGTLVSNLWMAAVGQPLTHHVRAELRRVDHS